MTDVPAACFGPELIAAYPDAKIVLTLRNVDSWYESVNATVVKSMSNPQLALLALLDPASVGKWKPMLEKMVKWFFDGNLEKNGKQVFRDHYDEIRRLVPKDRLLEYKVGEGWDRLCEFLGDDVPNEPFPNVNETAVFHDRMRAMTRRRFWIASRPYLLCLTFIILLISNFRQSNER